MRFDSADGNEPARGGWPENDMNCATDLVVMMRMMMRMRYCVGLLMQKMNERYGLVEQVEFKKNNDAPCSQIHKLKIATCLEVVNPNAIRGPSCHREQTQILPHNRGASASGILTDMCILTTES